jgi:ABC-type transport system involved in multi-copper enzyme maturation permease subunit
VLSWNALAGSGELRLYMTVTVLPVLCGTICCALFIRTARRLLHPPDVGSEGREVIDLTHENEKAVGMVIQFDQFPDRLLAPAKRTTLLRDGANPVFDKELRSEIFSQGTLMLRLVVQVSMFLALPLMAFCLYWKVDLAPWYIAYVLLFNVLVGPVFSAGSVTSERERQTLDLLLTTIISPFQILWGKLIAGLRVSSVLTSFLVWPVLLAWAMGSFGWDNVLAVPAFLAVILLTCFTTATVALFCSVLFRKTSTSMMTSYLIIGALFCLPLALRYFARSYFPLSPSTPWIDSSALTSPIAAIFSIPLKFQSPGFANRADSWNLFFSYAAFTSALDLILLGAIIWLFNTRWRVAE